MKRNHILTLFLKGFAARPNMGIPEVKDAFQGAFDQTVDWFKLHLLNA